MSINYLNVTADEYNQEYNNEIVLKFEGYHYRYYLDSTFDRPVNDNNPNIYLLDLVICEID